VIEFSCGCGKGLKVRDDLAGRTVRCPGCGATIRVPAGGEAPLSGPETLQAAMRDFQREQAAADVPVAETAETPPELEEAAQGLDALARAAGSRSEKAPPPRASTRRPGQASVSGGASNGKTDTKRKQALIIGGLAAVAVVMIVFIAVMATRDNAPPEEAAAPTPMMKTERPRGRFTGHQPGELFNKVPFEDERRTAEGEEDEDEAGWAGR